MNKTCKNCNAHFKGQYCSSCGQSANTHRFDASYAREGILHALHFEKGLFYTVRELFVRPGQVIREYMEGKRVKLVQPFAYLVFVCFIYSLLLGYLEPHAEGIGEVKNTAWCNAGKSFFQFMTDTHTMKYSQIFLAFPFALISYLAFRKGGLNYIEHVILNVFISAQIFVVDIVLLIVKHIVGSGAAMMFSIGETDMHITDILSMTFYIVYFSVVCLLYFKHQSKLQNTISVVLLLLYLVIGVFLFFTPYIMFFVVCGVPEKS